MLIGILTYLLSLLEPHALALYHFQNAQIGLGTNFSLPHLDKHNPIAYAACLRRDLKETDLIVAHRSLPCKSKVFIYVPRNKRYGIFLVGERGPYGKSGAIIDLAPATTKALKANGWETLVIVPIKKNRN